MNVLRLGQRARYDVIDRKSLALVEKAGVIVRLDAHFVWLKPDVPGRQREDLAPYRFVKAA